MKPEGLIGFAGLSHLGLVSSICAASRGFSVLGYDPDSALVENISRKKLPVHEPLLDETLKKASDCYSVTADIQRLSACDLVYISYDVKTDEKNQSDLTQLGSLIPQVLSVMKSGSTLVFLSQIPPGFTRTILPATKARNIALYCQVETLIFGRAVERALYPERYLVGCEEPQKTLPLIYENLLKAFDCPVFQMKYESAELGKISINMFLVSSVSTTNTLAEICEKVGASWSEIAPSLRLDKRIGQFAYLAPGLGIAGGNLERDLITIQGLSKEFGTDASVVDAWLGNSKYRCDWALRFLRQTVFEKLSKPKIAVWGMAYKQDTKSIKNSPSISLIKALGDHQIQAYDPQVVWRGEGMGFAQKNTALEACSDADVLVIMTPWKEFSEVSLQKVKEQMRGKWILDPFQLINRKLCSELGFQYATLGEYTC